MQAPKTISGAKRKRAIVVEGGAMRGIFAAGVLDKFIECHFRPFDFCIGVSAGASNLAAWLANQKGRNYRIMTDYSCRPEFISFKRLLAGGNAFDLDWLWEITIKEIRLDLETYDRQEACLYIVVTDIESGNAIYLKPTKEQLEDQLKASCSLPIVYKNQIFINGKAVSDGGLSDSIPVKKAYEMGAREITVILSHPLGYRKSKPICPWLVRRIFSNTPHLANRIIDRADHYNEALDFINTPPSDCQIHTIAPTYNFDVRRATTNIEKLNRGYEMGKSAALHFLERTAS